MPIRPSYLIKTDDYMKQGIKASVKQERRTRLYCLMNPPLLTILAALALLISLSACSPQQDVLEVEVTRYQVLEVPIVETRLVEVTREVEVVQEVEIEVTREVEVFIEPTAESVPGSAANPFQLLFIPSFPQSLIEVRGQFLVDELVQNTGYAFEIVVPDPEADIVSLVCSNSDTTIAFLTPEQYIEIKEACNAFPALIAQKFDTPYQLGMLVTRTSSVINVFEDISFKKIAVPDFSEIPTYKIFADEIAQSELPGVQYVEYGTSTSALIALLNKEVDIAAAFYNPPSMPIGEEGWRYDEDSPEIWRQLVSPPRRNPIGFIEVAGGPEAGGYRVRDARASIFDDYPEVFDETKILLLSQPYPNDMIAFGQNFPISAFNAVFNGILNHANSEACLQSMCASDFYQWDGAQGVDDGFFNVVRELQND